MDDWLPQPWLVLENTHDPGEFFTLTTRGAKHLILFTDPNAAAAFLSSFDDAALRIATLETWVLKDTYLSAAARIGATQIVLNYQHGQHQAFGASLAHTQEQILAALTRRQS